MPIAQGYPQGCIGSVLYKGSWLRGEQAEIPPCSTLPPRLLLSCILEVGVPFLICIRAREDPEIRFFFKSSSSSKRFQSLVFLSSPPTLWVLC